MLETRQATEEEKDRIRGLAGFFCMICGKEQLEIDDIFKIATIMVVSAFESAEEQVPKEDYDKLVQYYANMATSTVDFLSSKKIPEKAPDFINGTHKETIQ